MSRIATGMLAMRRVGAFTIGEADIKENEVKSIAGEEFAEVAVRRAALERARRAVGGCRFASSILGEGLCVNIARGI